jgi:hypothetical protein
MGPTTHVESVQALENLRGELGRFSGAAGLALAMAESEIGQTLTWLEERLHHWRTEQRRWRERVAETIGALTYCQNSGYYDDEGRFYAPSCGHYEMAVWEARKRLDEVEEKLQAAELHERFVAEAVDDYRLEASQLGDLLLNDVPRAAAFLNQKVAILNAFVALRAPVAGGVSPVSGGRPATVTSPGSRRSANPTGSMARSVGGGGAEGVGVPLAGEATPSEDAVASATQSVGTDSPDAEGTKVERPQPDELSEATG